LKRFDHIGLRAELSSRRSSSTPPKKRRRKTRGRAKHDTSVRLADRSLAAKRDGPGGDVSRLEREIDRLVYALYDLTAEEIKIVEASAK